MTWSYSANPSAANPKDIVRFLLGDTNEALPLVQDEEIYFSLSEVNGEPYRTASNVALSLAATFVQQAESESKHVGGLSLSKSYGDRGKKFEQLAKDLLMRSRRISPPMTNADPRALGGEFHVGEMDAYSAEDNVWPTDSDLGVSTQYGTGYDADGD